MIMDLKIMTDVSKYFYLILQTCIILSYAKENVPYGYCVDPYCSARIGIGILLSDYNSIEDPGFRIRKAEEFDIYVKGYGPKEDLWGIQIKNLRGYISKTLIREERTMERKLVPAELDFKVAHLNVQHTSQGQASWQNKEADWSGSMYNSHAQLSSDYQDFSQNSYYDEEMVSHNVYQSPIIDLQIPSNSYYENFGRDNENSFGMNSHVSVDGNQHFSPGHMQVSSHSFNVPESHVIENGPPSIIHPTKTVHPNAYPHTKDKLVGVRKNPQAYHAPDMKPKVPINHDSINKIERSLQGSSTMQHGHDSVSHHPHPESPVSYFNVMQHDFEQEPFQETNTQYFSSELENSIVPDSPLLEEVFSSSASSHSKEPHIMDGSAQMNLETTLQGHDSVPYQGQYESQVSNLNTLQQKLPLQQRHHNEFQEPIQQNLHLSDGISTSFASEQMEVASETPHAFGHSGVIDRSAQMNLETPNVHNMHPHHRHPESQSSHFDAVKPNLQQVTFQEPHHASNLQNPMPPHASNVMSNSFVAHQIPKQTVSHTSVQHEKLLHSTMQNTPMSSSFIDEKGDFDKTLSLLHKQGISDANMFDNQYSSQSSEIKNNVGLMDDSIKSTTSQNTVDERKVDTLTDLQNLETPVSEYITKASQFLGKSSLGTHKQKLDDFFETFLDAADDEEDEDEDENDEIEIESEVKNTSHNIEFNENSPLENALDNSVAQDNSLPSIEQNSDNQFFNQDLRLNPIKDEVNEKFVENEILNTSNLESVTNSILDPVQNVFSLDQNPAPKDESIGTPHHVSESSNILKKGIEFEAQNEIKLDSAFSRESKENSLHLSDSNEISNDISSYQKRNLKGDIENDLADAELENDENSTNFGANDSFQNGLEAIRSFVETVMSWIPEPIYSYLMDLREQGIPPRVPVFTALISFPCVLLIITIFYIKERSKENELSAQLIAVEKNAYTLSAEKNILEEQLETAQAELSKLGKTSAEERNSIFSLTHELASSKKNLEEINLELQNSLDEIKMLKQKEDKYLVLLDASEKEKLEFQESKELNEVKLQDLEDSIDRLNNILEENENEIKKLQKEKLEFLQCKEDNEEKITLLEQNCNQLLKEAEVWNLRVNELNEKLNQESSLNKELEANLLLKGEEIESFKSLVATFQTFEEVESSPEINPDNSKDEKIQLLLNSSMILIKLQKKEEENDLLSEKLEVEKKKNLDMEVEILDAKSDIDKLKLNYNQALQDKAEAQTKLDVLTNYFKDKEIQLQRELGAQEAVRQKKEEDASSAERRITLIDQENASYKYQVASMKQEMEETERNLKSQIAAQEKKAHENWIAARAAERKLEDMKQEVTQLKQRLTMLEREQEAWTNASQDDIVRPVPKRMPILDSSGSSQDMNSTLDMRPPPWPPLPHERLPPPPMMLPPDRPLPPLHPPPMHPFLPPPPPLESFRPQHPWHMPPDGSDFRTTPPEFLRARESTPPRGRHTGFADGDIGQQNSSPLGTETRDSRNSTPPHSLPDFHDIPPPHPRPYFPHPGPVSRFPLPPFRRDLAQGPKKIDNQDDFSSTSRGSQPPVPQERWQHSNTRV